MIERAMHNVLNCDTPIACPANMIARARSLAKMKEDKEDEEKATRDDAKDIPIIHSAQFVAIRCIETPRHESIDKSMHF